MPRAARGSSPLEGSIPVWHPWQETTGHLPFLPMWWNPRDTSIYTMTGTRYFHVSSLDDLLMTVTRDKLYLFCQDILDQTEFSYADELLAHEALTPYLTGRGHVVATRVSRKRKSGYLIPASSFQWKGPPNAVSTENIWNLFRMFGMQSSTSASLSEKVLRATLPEKLFISRPGIGLRDSLLLHGAGPRIDEAELALYERTFCYDKNKAYLYHSRSVPSPYLTPVLLFNPTLDECLAFCASWVHVRIVVCATSLVPCKMFDDYVPGEVVDCWLWNEELEDCLNVGYKLLQIYGGYGFREMSGFMERWAEILWEKYLLSKQMNEHVQAMIKAMMVGVPGRFLRKPEKYSMAHVSAAQPGDVPIQFKQWREDNQGKVKVLSDYVVHAEHDRQAAALTVIGDYIRMKMRQELYRRMCDEMRLGNTVIRSYVDMYATTLPTRVGDVGTSIGQWKEKQYERVLADGNRFIGYDRVKQAYDMAAPGLAKTGAARVKLWQRYYRLLEENGIHVADF